MLFITSYSCEVGDFKVHGRWQSQATSFRAVALSMLRNCTLLKADTQSSSCLVSVWYCIIRQATYYKGLGKIADRADTVDRVENTTFL